MIEPILIKIVHSLRIAKGTNAKLAILKKHEDNEMWKKFLVYTYDTRQTYGVNCPSYNEFSEVPIKQHMFDHFDHLVKREVTGNNAKQLVGMLSTMYGEIPRLVLGRSIKAGVSFKTINKAYPGLITVFESMKGKDCKIESYPVFSSIKYDGVKVFTFVTGDDIFFTSSSGAEFDLSSLRIDMQGMKEGIYEGELIYKEGKVVHRPKITGFLNSLLAGTKDDIIDDYSYMIYDYIPTQEWVDKFGVKSFLERHAMILESIEDRGGALMHVKFVEQVPLKSLEQVAQFFNYYNDQGYEGSMHRYPHDPYRWDRSERLIKKKAIRECILICTSVTPHTNPSKGNIGSLHCVGFIHDKEAGEVEVSVNVGSGLSKYDIQFDEDRYLNQRIEVIYNSVTKTDKGYSLFIPRYKRIVGGL